MHNQKVIHKQLNRLLLHTENMKKSKENSPLFNADEMTGITGIIAFIELAWIKMTLHQLETSKNCYFFVCIDRFDSLKKGRFGRL